MPNWSCSISGFNAMGIPGHFRISEDIHRLAERINGVKDEILGKINGIPNEIYEKIMNNFVINNVYH